MSNTFMKKMADKVNYKADDNEIYEKRLALAQLLEEFGSLPMLVVSGFLQKSIGGMFFNGTVAFVGIVLAWILPANVLFNAFLFLSIFTLLKIVFSATAVDKAIDDMLKNVKNREIIYEKLLKSMAKHAVCTRTAFETLGAQNQLMLMIVLTFFVFFIPLPVFATIGLLLIALFPVYNIISKQEAERFLASPPVSPRVRTNHPIRGGVPDSLVSSLRNDQTANDAASQLVTSLIPPPPPPPPAKLGE
ncbi:Hypothetical protein GLP15_416 [Giardia lamblia P15]|uniref:Uncharacterized protein n=1 Tax=Giardia intestinalis (strain P15) TaxID=658858 RepID=E1EXG2_GIAIA|nr:Hypothetical protein GLP15_416 [Giardia lamblia P15]